LKKGKEDFTVMRAKVLGKSGVENVGYEYLIYDKYDSKSGMHSMSRTTGFACISVAEILLDGSFTKHGIITPEAIAGTDGLFTRIMNYMEDRGVEITISRLY
jgi:saccharopine dehydrogenase-like NADP-dependent oxidoreductase